MNKAQELNVQVNVLEIANSSNSTAVKHTFQQYYNIVLVRHPPCPLPSHESVEDYNMEILNC